MTTSITAVDFNMTEVQKDLVNKKLDRIKYADDLIIDLSLKIKQEKKFIFECTLNFRWGTSAHVSADDFDFAAGVNKLMDTLDQKVKKEKDKIQGK